MNAIEKPRYSVEKEGKPILPRSVSSRHEIYLPKGSQLTGQREVFHIFSGIDIIFNECNTNVNDCCLETKGRLLEINYCLKGRQECRWLCDHYLYLGEGDLCITRMEHNSPSPYFPFGYYKGITIILDLDILQNHILPIISSSKIQPECFDGKFCPGHHFFAIGAHEQISHVFQELYYGPKENRLEYFQLKILEILLLLHELDPKKQHKISGLGKNQIEIVYQVQKRLLENLNENPTIEQLAKEFCLSPTSLKANFKQVYNTTIKDYLRKERMAKAAALLRTGSQTIAEIALSVGYTNQSKFSSAFKTLYGMPPVMYRKKNLHEFEHK